MEENKEHLIERLVDDFKATTQGYSWHEVKSLTFRLNLLDVEDLKLLVSQIGKAN